MARILMYLAVCVAIVGLVGCSGPTGDRPATVKAGGTVTVDGQPLSGATVMFAPAGGKGTSAAGMTDADGKFKLMTGGKWEGAVPGKYNVAITKYAAPAQLSSEEYAKAQMQRKSATDASQLAKSEVPQKYVDPSTSGLTADIAKDGANDFKFELKK